MTTRVTSIDKPGRIDFNLDTLNLEAAPPPFTFVAGGKRFTVEHIEEHDWQDLLDFDGTDPAQTIQMMLGDAQYAKFRAVRGVSMRKIKPLLEAIQAHFGLGEAPEDGASPGS